MLHLTEYIRLCNVCCPDFSSPKVQILKNMPMNTAKMVKVKIPMNGLFMELVQPYDHKPGFSSQQPFLIMDVQLIFLYG